MEMQKININTAEINEEKSDETVLCIGLDIGTTTVSAVVLDIKRGVCKESYTLPNDSAIAGTYGWEKMQDPGRILTRVQEVLDVLLEKHENVKAIGVTGQMHGIVYVDGSGSAVSPLYTWQDERAAQGNPSPCQRILEQTGYHISPGYGLATGYANCLLSCVPQNAKKVCTIMDYVAMALCGGKEPKIHSSNAAGLGFYQIDCKKFDEKALETLGISPAWLPEVTADCEILGITKGFRCP